VHPLRRVRRQSWGGVKKGRCGRSSNKVGRERKGGTTSKRGAGKEGEAGGSDKIKARENDRVPEQVIEMQKKKIRKYERT